MALTADVSGGRPCKAHRHQTNTTPGKSGHLFFTGAIICVDAQGRAVPGAADGAVRAAGVSVTKKFPDDPGKNHHLDTRTTGDGSWVRPDMCQYCVEYDEVGNYHFTSVLGAPVVGGWAYVVDDETVSADPTPEMIILGVFTQNKDGGWFVDVGRKNPGLGVVNGSPFDLVPPVFVTLAAASAPVSRSDVVQFDVGASLAFSFTVTAGAQNGGADFFGVAADDAQPGEVFKVWRGGYYPVRTKGFTVVNAFQLLAAENTTVRPFNALNDLAIIGRALSPGLAGNEIITCEIYWPVIHKIG